MNVFQAALSAIMVGALILSGMQFNLVWAKSLHYKINGENQVVFNSDAPVQVIQGKTSKVMGEVILDDSFKFDKAHPFQIDIHVDLASIDTGIELRNQHMRDNFLETDKYPQASFKATSIKIPKTPNLTKAQTVNLIAIGDFTVHGVTTQKTIPLKVEYQPASGKSAASIRIQGKFPVKLAEHKIQRPEALSVKLAETVFVTLHVSAKQI